MHRKAAMTIAILVGIAAILLPIAASLYMAGRQSYREQMAIADRFAAEVLRRSEASSEESYAALRELAAAGASDPCSDENIRRMARLDISSMQLQAVGYVANDRLMCSSLGRHGAGTPVGPPDYLSASGPYIRTSVEFPVAPGTKFLLVTDRTTGYSALIHRELPISVLTNDPEISLGMVGYSAKKLIMGRGSFDPAWIRALGDGYEAQIFDGDHLIAIKRSQKYDFAAFVSIPSARIAQGLHHTALVLVPIGVLAGIALALVVVYLTRIQLALPALIKTALKQKEFSVAYQPIVDLRTGQWIGAEALIRWQHPSGRAIRPDVFIPVAEETGLIRRITERVIEIVARDASQLFKRYGYFHIGINLSSADLQSERTLELLRRLASDTHAGRGNLLVEATERGFMGLDVVRDMVRSIRAAGIRVAIDDFGTGYSSLSYLETFEVDFLKIDKSFVDKIGLEAATSQVILHIIEMAKGLKLEMIAEGIETELQARFLRERGVHYGQGWLFGKPMGFAELAGRLRRARNSVDDSATAQPIPSLADRAPRASSRDHLQA
jgi:sensor c-di-GMP phosphodiesterase-like protein